MLIKPVCAVSCSEHHSGPSLSKNNEKKQHNVGGKYLVCPPTADDAFSSARKCENKCQFCRDVTVFERFSVNR